MRRRRTKRISKCILAVVTVCCLYTSSAALQSSLGDSKESSSTVQSLVQTLQNDSLSFGDRLKAVRELATLQANAAPAVPAMLELVDDSQKGAPETEKSRVHQQTVFALTRIGKAAVPELIKGLQHESVHIRKVSSISMLRIQPTSKEAFKALKTATTDDEDYVRNHAIHAMAVFGADAVPVLVAALQNPNDQVSASIALGKIGYAAEPAVPQLLKLLESANLNIRNRAATAVAKIGPKSAKAADALANALKTTDETTRGLVIDTLRNMGTKAKKAAPALVEILKHGDRSLWVSALDALGEIGTTDPATTARIVELLDEDETAIRLAAAQALRKLDPKQATKLLGDRVAATEAALADVALLKVGTHDWPQWGGSRLRNNTPKGKNIATDWDIKTGRNIKWQIKLGSQSYGNPIVANGKVYVGTNNGAGHLQRYPANVDLGVLLCIDEQTGKFLWQLSRPKLASGRVHDWPLQGLCGTPVVDGNRLWVVTNRCEVICLDTDGFLDGENDGPFKSEPNENKDEADIVWQFDMMKELKVSPHNMSFCSLITDGKRLFVNTSNGVGSGHNELPSPNAPSFIAIDRDEPKVLWSDNSPGANVLHGQWSSPSYAVLGGRPQVLFGGGDGWLYSFDPAGDGDGRSKLLWKFDCNPKDSMWVLGGRGTRNNIVAFPVIYDDLVYVAVGQDPEHGEGMGHLWCIDPTKFGDVSPELAIDAKGRSIPHRRLQAIIERERLFYASISIKAVAELNAGRLPTALRDEFQKAKVELPKRVSLRTDAKNRLWSMIATIDGLRRRFRLAGNRLRNNATYRFTVTGDTNERAFPNPNSAMAHRNKSVTLVWT